MKIGDSQILRGMWKHIRCPKCLSELWWLNEDTGEHNAQCRECEWTKNLWEVDDKDVEFVRLDGCLLVTDGEML